DRFWSVTRAGAADALLVAPLGLSPGALYSAVRHTQPGRLLVLTSSAARARLDEALAAAGRPDLDCFTIELQDPHAGFGEVGAVASDEQLRRALLSAEEVVISVTGGTTALQFAAERVRDRARELGVPARRIALVDRRPYAEQ